MTHDRIDLAAQVLRGAEPQQPDIYNDPDITEELPVVRPRCGEGQ